MEGATPEQGGDTQAVLQVVAAPPDPELQADMFELAGHYFFAALVIFLARRLLDLFRVDHD